MTTPTPQQDAPDKWRCLSCGNTFNKKPDPQSEYSCDTYFNGKKFVPKHCNGTIVRRSPEDILAETTKLTAFNIRINKATFNPGFGTLEGEIFLTGHFNGQYFKEEPIGLISKDFAENLDWIYQGEGIEQHNDIKMDMDDLRNFSWKNPQYARKMIREHIISLSQPGHEE